MGQAEVYKFLKRPENIQKFFTCEQIATATGDKLQLVNRACLKLAQHGEITRGYEPYYKIVYGITKTEIHFVR